MRQFVRSPHFPDNCGGLIYGEKYADRLEKALERLQIESLLMPDNPCVDPRLASHADLSVLHLGGERMLAAPFLEGRIFAQTLRASGASLAFPQFRQSPTYPHDAQLNLCLCAQRAILSAHSVLPDIIKYLTNEGDIQFCSCRQGYTRCAACLVDEESLITTDRGVARAATDAGIEVLLISAGHIRLDGFAYGFLGGASFKIASDKLAFTGVLDGHPDRESILRFLAERSIEPVFLSQEPIFDIGSAIPIWEKEL